MPIRLITPPDVLPVSLDAARIAARLDGTDSDVELEQAIRTHTEDVEHLTGRALITQTWSLTAAGFPAHDGFPERMRFPEHDGAIALPKAPLISVAYIKYYDADNVQQTLDPAAYLVDAAAEPALIAPAPGTRWPAPAARSNAVEIQYTCGYGADDSAVPDAIKGYILAKVQAQFVPAPAASLDAVERLLDRYKVYG